MYYDKLIFEISQTGRKGYTLPQSEVKAYDLPQDLVRDDCPGLPEVSELDVVRHYTNVSFKNFGIEKGFYPLGSCTMKYNPKINQDIANLKGFTALHPYQSERTVQGILELYDQTQKMLSEISGLDTFTLNPYAGAHGELVGLMIMKAYHASRGEAHRTKVIVPDSAHGTNPASATVAGLESVEVKSNKDGSVSVSDLKHVLDENVAGIMLTNPNTLGMFEK
ncbi:MAG: aminomethyl-transferring glycine dehydrogenase subunit GcvPB, partial [Bacillota bacterium]